MNMSASDVINTYVYRVGLVQNNYSYSTAVGLFNSVINMALVIAANQLSKNLPMKACGKGAGMDKIRSVKKER